MSKVTDIKAPKVDRIKGVNFTYADCNNRVLHAALEKLDNATVFNGADLSRFMKIKGAYDRKAKEVSRLFKKLVDKHAHQEPVMRMDKDQGKEVPVLKPNGKPQTKPRMIPTGRGRMDFDFRDRKAFNEDYKLLMQETFDVEAYRLLTEDLVKAGLTPKEIRACAKLLTDIDPELLENSPIFDDDEAEDEDEEDDDQEDAPEAAESPSEAPNAHEVPNDPNGAPNVSTGN